MNHPAMRSFVVVSTTAVLFFLLPLAQAQQGGYDLLQTAPGAKVDLAKLSLGSVSLKGVPIDSCTGTADTIMERTQEVPAGGGKVAVHVYALFMKSTRHVTIQGESADLYVTINDSNGAISTSVLPQPDALPGSPGTLTVRRNHTFDSDLQVNADLIFVKAGASPTNAANVLRHEPAPTITLQSVNSPWSSKAFAGYPKCSKYPANGFYPRPQHKGPHPVTPSTRSKPSPTPEKG